MRMGRRQKRPMVEDIVEILRNFNREDLLASSFETPASLSRKLPARGKRCPDMDGYTPACDDGRYSEEAAE